MQKILTRAIKTPPRSEANRANQSYRQGTFAALKIPVYRIFFGALVMQMTAMNMQMVARSWFMYELTGSAVMLAVITLYYLLLAPRMRRLD